MEMGAPEPERAVIRDTELECPTCGYNLTGLTENRCPECGSDFDRAALMRLSQATPTAANPWDYDRSIGAFLQTWGLAAFEPSTLAREFPRQHCGENAAVYSLVCYAVGAAVFVLLGFLAAAAERYSSGLMCPVFGICAIAVLACWLCETAIAALLALLVRPTHAKERYHFWRGLTHYTSGFVILSGARGGLLACSVTWLMGDPTPGVACLGVSGSIIFLLWCNSLWRMIWCRGRSDSARLLGCVIVPLVGVAAILLASFIAAHLMESRPV